MGPWVKRFQGFTGFCMATARRLFASDQLRSPIRLNELVCQFIPMDLLRRVAVEGLKLTDVIVLSMASVAG